jgi:hypothetical protein
MARAPIMAQIPLWLVAPEPGVMRSGFLFCFRGLPRFALQTIFQIHLHCGCRPLLVKNGHFHFMAHRFDYFIQKG